jgi:hypothetical protein
MHIGIRVCVLEPGSPNTHIRMRVRILGHFAYRYRHIYLVLCPLLSTWCPSCGSSNNASLLTPNPKPNQSTSNLFHPLYNIHRRRPAPLSWAASLLATAQKSKSLSPTEPKIWSRPLVVLLTPPTVVASITMIMSDADIWKVEIGPLKGEISCFCVSESIEMILQSCHVQPLVVLRSPARVYSHAINHNERRRCLR